MILVFQQAMKFSERQRFFSLVQQKKAQHLSTHYGIWKIWLGPEENVITFVKLLYSLMESN